MPTTQAETTDVTTTASFPVVKFSPTDVAIANMSRQYMPLVIADADDKAGYDVVHRARMDCRNTRVAAEKYKKSLKADALEYCKKVDADFSRVKDGIAPIEAHLEAQEDAYEAAKAKIKQAAEEARQQALRERLTTLRACGADYDPLAVMRMTDAEFEVVLVKAEADHKAAAAKAAEEEAERQKQAAESQRKADQFQSRMQQLADFHSFPPAILVERWTNEEFAEKLVQAEKLEAETVAVMAQQKADAEKLAAERAELDRQRAEQQAALDAQRKQQEAEAARLAAESKRLADAENERQRLVELEAAKKEAAEQALIEAEQRHAREVAAQQRRAEIWAAQEKADAEAREAARVRAEALRPDREKLLVLAMQIEAVEVPTLSFEATEEVGFVRDEILTCAARIREIAEQIE